MGKAILECGNQRWGEASSCQSLPICARCQRRTGARFFFLAGRHEPDCFPAPSGGPGRGRVGRRAGAGLRKRRSCRDPAGSRPGVFQGGSRPVAGTRRQDGHRKRWASRGAPVSGHARGCHRLGGGRENSRSGNLSCLANSTTCPALLAPRQQILSVLDASSAGTAALAAGMGNAFS